MKNIILTFIIIPLFTICLYSQESNKGTTIKLDTGYINVDEGKLFYEIAGEGEYIVLLHDGILHHVIWDAQFPVLAKNYKVVRYDRRGFGKSSEPKAPFSLLDDLNQLFVQLKIDRAIVFGVSAGGALAIEFALEYPEKINALVLSGAVVGGYDFSKHALTRGGRISSLADYREPEKFIQYFGWDDPYEVNPENKKAKEKFFKLLKANPQNIKGALGYFAQWPQRPAVKILNQIKVPALILAGEYDIPDVHAHAGVIEMGIPNAKREIIPESGHLIPLEQPEAFNAAVSSFLNGLEFIDILNSDGVDSAVQYFRKKRETASDIILFEEKDMNALGYRFLQNGKIKDAIKLFKLNTLAYPNSGNVYDSLGEAYMENGQNDLAIKNYRKSLEINPGNDNAKRKLAELE